MRDAGGETLMPVRFHLDRYPPRKEPVTGDGTDAYGRIGIDARRVTRDEAVEFMIHHLVLATAYYEATPNDEADVLNETVRILNNDIQREGPELTGARAFLAALNTYYARLKKEQDEEETA
jgi:hypothetical protein